MMLDQKALEAARNHIDTIIHKLPGALRESYHEVAQAHTTTYLSAIAPADVTGHVTALTELVNLVAAESTGPSTEDEPDAESVGWNDAGPLPMTFGHIRRAQAALTALVSISADLAAVKAENSDLVKERDRAMQWRDHDKERAESAESSLASERAAHARMRKARDEALRLLSRRPPRLSGRF